MAIQELKNSTGIHVVVFSVYIVVFSVSPPPCPFFSPPSQFSSKISNILAITLSSEDRCHGSSKFESFQFCYPPSRVFSSFPSQASVKSIQTSQSCANCFEKDFKVARYRTSQFFSHEREST